MKIRTLFFSVMLLSLPTLCIAQDEKEAGSEAAATENVEQKQPEDTNQDSIAVQVGKMVANGDIRDAFAHLEKFVEDNPIGTDANDVQRGYAMVVNAFNRTRNIRESYKAFQSVLDYQLKCIESGVDGIRISGTVQTLGSIANRVNKKDEVLPALERAQEVLETRIKDGDNSDYRLELSTVRMLIARDLLANGKEDECMVILKSEHQAILDIMDSDTENELVKAFYLRSLSGLMRHSSDEAFAEKNFKEHQKVLSERIVEQPGNMSFSSQYVAGNLLWANKKLATDPDASDELLDDAERTLSALISVNENAEKALAGIERQIVVLKRRVEGQKQILSLLNSPAPKFDAEAWVNGTELDLEGMKGKVVMLDFWAVWCGPCIRTFPKVKKLIDTYEKDGLRVVGATRYYGFGWDADKKTPVREAGIDAESEAEAISLFMEKYELPYPSLIMPADSTMSAEFGVTGIPHVVLIGKKGNVRLVKVGAAPEVAAEIEATIKELLAE